MFDTNIVDGLEEKSISLFLPEKVFEYSVIAKTKKKQVEVKMLSTIPSYCAQKYSEMTLHFAAYD